MLSILRIPRSSRLVEASGSEPAAGLLDELEEPHVDGLEPEPDLTISEVIDPQSLKARAEAHWLDQNRVGMPADARCLFVDCHGMRATQQPGRGQAGDA